MKKLSVLLLIALLLVLTVNVLADDVTTKLNEDYGLTEEKLKQAELSTNKAKTKLYEELEDIVELEDKFMQPGEYVKNLIDLNVLDIENVTNLEKVYKELRKPANNDLRNGFVNGSGEDIAEEIEKLLVSSNKKKDKSGGLDDAFAQATAESEKKVEQEKKETEQEKQETEQLIEKLKQAQADMEDSKEDMEDSKEDMEDSKEDMETTNEKLKSRTKQLINILKNTDETISEKDSNRIIEIIEDNNYFTEEKRQEYKEIVKNSSE